MPKIIVIGGQDKGLICFVGSRRATIGRAVWRTVPLSDPQSERLQAEIVATPEGHQLRDLGLRTHTRLNDRPVQEAKLVFGDILEVGDTRLLFQDDSFSSAEVERMLAGRSGATDASGVEARAHRPAPPSRTPGKLQGPPSAGEPSRLLSHVAGAVAAKLEEPLKDLLTGFELLLEDVQGAARSGSPESARKTVELMSRLTEGCLEVVSNLWHYAHGDDSVEVHWLSLVETLEGVTGRMQGVLARKRVRVELHAPQKVPRIAANSAQVETVFVNLIRNALEATAGDCSLHLHVVPGPHWIEVRIVDPGEGIAPEDLPLVFHEGFTTRPGNVGLGLALCKKLVGRHGGTLAVESNTGAGTMVRVSFPVSAEGAGTGSC